jgi:hypothetical protein
VPVERLWSSAVVSLRLPTKGTRVLHAPFDVGGNAYGLSRAERELGLESDVVVVEESSFAFGVDLNLRAGLGQPRWRRLQRRAAFLARAMSRYDIFHYNFGRALLTTERFGRVFDELALVKRAGKTVLVTFQGCDARPHEECFCRNPICAAESPYRAKRASRMARLADRAFYLNPDLRNWVPGGRWLPYASVDPRAIEPAPPGPHEAVTIAHAPTDRHVKGTRHVIEAVEALQAEGLSVRLELLEGLSHEQTVQRCAEADIVVDQLLIGWYGAFAVEAMALSKPVLCFIREDDPLDNPLGAELPIVRTNPATLVSDLRALTIDARRRRDVGLAGRRFVEKHHDPRTIATTVLDGLV